ncbi:MAG: EAL domain-containing protein [Reinekea sp.]
MTLTLYKGGASIRGRKRLLHYAAILLGYYGFAQLALGLSKEPGSIALVWYPNIVAGLILSQLSYRHWWPGLVAVAIAQLSAVVPLPGQPLTVDLVFTATAMTNVLLIAHFVKKHQNLKNVYNSPIDFAKVLMVLSIVPAAAAATVSSMGLFLNGFANLDRAWIISFVSLLLGTLTLAPPIIAVQYFGIKRSIQELVTPQSFGFISACALASIYVFMHLAYPFAYLAFALVVAALYTNIITISFVTSLCNVLITTLAAHQLYTPVVNEADFTGILFYLPVMIILIPAIALSVSQNAHTYAIDQLEEQMTRTRSALFNMPALLCTVDQTGNTILASKKFLRIMELDTTDLLNYPFSKIVSDGSLDKYQREIFDALQRGEDVENVTIKVHSRYGREIHLSVSATSGGDDYLGEENYHLYIQNISEEIRLTEQLREENEMMSITLRSIGDGVITTDKSGKITFLNYAAESLLGLKTKEAEGRHFNDIVHLYDEKSGKRLDCPIDRVLQEKSVQGIPDFAVFKNGTGDAFAIQDSISPIKNYNGDVVGTIMVFQDVTETRKITQKMSYLAQHDMLTDLPNRTLLMDRINLSIARSKRSQFQFGIAFMDLDNFKMINDTQGHEAGDLLLQIVASRLRKHVRGEDTISRIGGDEFVFIFEGISDSKDLSKICNKIINDVNKPMVINHKSATVSCSIGITIGPTDGEDAETLMRRADAAMYRAKHSGRARFCFYSHEIEKQLARSIELEDSLRTAFNEKEFFLYYQPIVDSKNYEVYATESLCRWKDPKTNEMISPETFIPMLENIGLIDDVGQYLFNAACKQMSDWEQQGKTLNMSVNISAKQLVSPQFIDNVATTLASHNLAGNRFIFEITESLLLNNTNHCINILRKLRSMGIRIAIDDFGDGYSSLGYLKKFPFDILKIDKQFIQELDQNPQDVIFVKAILEMAKALSLCTVAEGVENERQAEVLRELGCDTLQGFYFSAAESGPEIRSRLVKDTNILQFPIAQ